MASTSRDGWVDFDIAPEAATAYQTDAVSGLDGLTAFALYFACGIGLYFWAPHEPNWRIACAVAAGLTAAAVKWSRLLPIAALLLGLATGAWHAAGVTPVPSSLPDTARRLTGVIESVEARAGGRTRVVLAVEDGVRGVAGAHISTWQTVDDIGNLVGHTISVRARLAHPPGPALPYRYDHARRLFFEDVQAMGTAVGRVYSIAPPSAARDAFANRLHSLRTAIAVRVDAAMDEPAAGIAKALLIGVRGEIDEATLETVRQSGLAHVLAISGLHMGLICSLLFAITRYTLSFASGVIAVASPKKIAAAIALAGGGAYLILSGHQIATQRAFIMVLVSCCAVLLDRPALTFRNIAIAGVIVLALQPESLLSAGFQMSFAATGALVFVFGLWTGERDGASYNRFGRSILTLVGTSAVAGAASGVFAAYHFNTIAAYGLLANVLAMPIFGTVVMPAGLLAMLVLPFGLEALPLAVMELGLGWVTGVADFVTNLDGAIRRIASPPAFVLATGAALAYRIFATQRLTAAGLAMAGVVAGIMLTGWSTRPDLIVGESGKIAALRLPDQTSEPSYHIIGGRSSTFTTEVWQQALNAKTSEDARCDTGGCIMSDGKRRIALATDPASLLQACLDADIIVTPLSAPASCTEGSSGQAVLPGVLTNAGSRFYAWRDGKLVRTAQSAPGRPWRVSARQER